MADNVSILDGNSSLVSVAADDISGHFFQRVKLDVGADGASVPWAGEVASLFERVTPVRKSVDFTASQTAQTIWTPQTDKKFAALVWIVSFSAAGALTVFDGTDDLTGRLFKLHGAANGGMAVPFALPALAAAQNNVMKYTTGSGAAGSLTVYGYEVA